MQTILNLHSSYGLPLCVSGIAHHLALSMEIADHDRRRKAMKKQRSQVRERVFANRDMGSRIISGGDAEEIKEGEVTGDLAADLDVLCYSMGCTAKAA